MAVQFPACHRVGLFLLLLEGVTLLRGQDVYTPIAPGTLRTPKSESQIVLRSHSTEMVASFDQLIKMSQIIVDGTVSAILLSINRNPNIPGEVETDSLITVNRVIHGTLAPTSQIVLLADGGTQGTWQVSIQGDRAAQVGDHYILFLAADLRKEVPNSAGILPDVSVAPRYFPVGQVSGKALIEASGTVSFPAGAVQAVKQYDGMSELAFDQALTARLAVLFHVTPPYPSGVKPIIPPKPSIFPSSAAK